MDDFDWLTIFQRNAGWFTKYGKPRSYHANLQQNTKVFVRWETFAGQCCYSMLLWYLREDCLNIH